MIKNWTKFNENSNIEYRESRLVKGVEITKFFQSDRYKKFLEPHQIKENDFRDYFSDVFDNNDDIRFELNSDTVFFKGKDRIYNFQQADSAFKKYAVSISKTEIKSTTISDFKSHLNKYLDLLEDIEIAIERIKDDYDIERKVSDQIGHYTTERVIRVVFYKEIPYKELMSEFKLFLTENDSSSWLVKGLESFKEIFKRYGAPENFKLEDHIDLHPDWEHNEFGDVVVGVSLEGEISAIGTIDKETGQIDYNTIEIEKVIKELL